MKQEYNILNLKFLDNLEKYKEDNIFIAKISKGIKSKEELFDVYIDKLKLPWYFGRNWDAFDEVLTDLNWINEKTIVIYHQDLPISLLKKDLRIYLEVLVDSVEDWTKRPIGDFEGAKEHELIVVFPIKYKKEIEDILKNKK